MTSLSVADLLNGLICVLPLAVVYIGNISVDSSFCKLQALVLKVVQITKVMLLLALNFDRYIAVTRALRYHDILTPNRVYMGNAAIWIISCIASLTDAFVVKWEISMTYDAVMLCVFKVDVKEFLVWLDLVLLVILPLVVTIMIYIRLAAVARHHAAQIGVMPTRDGNHDNNQQRLALQNQAQKASKTTRVMTLVFTIACMPIVIAGLLASYIDFSDIPWVLNSFIIISFCSGLCNIIVYFCKNSVIRATSRAMVGAKLLPCQQLLTSSFTRVQKFFSRIRPGRNSQHTSELDSEVGVTASPPN
ncbi:probable G-protein coupled receptor 52 [Acanthaster planci]|uniref:Probable G-protein coupled receptor 52 n=1 Tax=Acanthaster planci TaxID=133434 RepID=A0A8B7YIW9_ACAPL|nr:probable G-protein coupled receptor 52 [Acanthaster planci]XP_022092351.1 probable G-protein coupled receptor 52 [Acanthaster planci]